MQIVIDIPEEIYESSKRECEETDDLIIDTFTLAIGNGIPLPKGHGDLKDANALAIHIAMLRDKWNYYGNEYESACFQTYDNAIDEIVDAPVIIEADKEE